VHFGIDEPDSGQATTLSFIAFSNLGQTIDLLVLFPLNVCKQVITLHIPNKNVMTLELYFLSLKFVSMKFINLQMDLRMDHHHLTPEPLQSFHIHLPRLLGEAWRKDCCIEKQLAVARTRSHWQGEEEHRIQQELVARNLLVAGHRLLLEDIHTPLVLPEDSHHHTPLPVGVHIHWKPLTLGLASPELIHGPSWRRQMPSPFQPSRLVHSTFRLHAWFPLLRPEHHELEPEQP
jgi:hypothetical protein